MPDVNCKSFILAFGPFMQLVKSVIKNSANIKNLFIELNEFLYLYSCGLRLLNCQVLSRLNV